MENECIESCVMNRGIYGEQSVLQRAKIDNWNAFSSHRNGQPSNNSLIFSSSFISVNYQITSDEKLLIEFLHCSL